MILVLAGTSDGRELAQMLADHGYQVLTSVTSDYGAALAQTSGLKVVTGKLGIQELIQFIIQNHITILIDGTHPYAENASKNAIVACQHVNIPYIRYERSTLSFADHMNLTLVDSYLEAAEMANHYSGTVFLTTGSNHLDLFVDKITDKTRIVARVLPSAEIIQKCISLGLNPAQIIAMQGPFSRELNKAMYRHYQAGLIITKESGSTGGTDEKILAAQELKIPIIMITRPKIHYPCLVSNKQEVLERIRKWEK